MNKKNIIVYGITRSATTLLTNLIRVSLNASKNVEAFNPEWGPSIDEQIDQYNFEASTDNPLVLNMHANFLPNFNKNQLERWISVLENRDFHIIELRRQNFRELVFSNYIAKETGEFWIYSQPAKKFIAEKEKIGEWIKNLSILQRKMDEGSWGIPVHQKITMEQFLEDKKITIGEKDFYIDIFPIKILNSNSAPKKSDSIENYEEALKMYDELIQNYYT